MSIKWKVALVEDDRRLARAVATGLGEEGYTVRWPEPFEAFRAGTIRVKTARGAGTTFTIELPA